MSDRLAVKKTYKLFINGQFPRSESGRTFPVHGHNVSRGSRKDLREAVVAARKAQPGWQKATAYLRGQILYRVAEVLETRKAAFQEELQWLTGASAANARREVEKSIDRLVWYAGWSDKYPQVFGSVNPVAAPYFNFTLPEPIGVVGVIAPEEAPLLGLVSKLAPIIISGNTVVALASEAAPCTAISFAEVLATSDVPAGVVNILTGSKSEFIPVLAKHMDINAIDYSGQDAATIQLLQQEAAFTVKRILIRETPNDRAWWDDRVAQSPYWITEATEMKTAWHPIGL
ncbi:MAG: aldehyde dehydrogenase family protein [Deltaproteobacteria bacterium]|nr:aldehyde dehydrogenase family protein [Deltaproteobacteria bacterium]